ncbi:hypothetical protein F5Y15DRAFT_392177 [Xylariaceae sp. FL0016]|nr:hypothetical protein F5Y15DRAFT_392177 [Xylariaceae sp. FL0016]
MPLIASDTANQARASDTADLPASSTITSAQDRSGSGQPAPTGAGVNTGAGTMREKTEAEKEADRLYEEAMEEEYAKREGGA